MPKELVSKTYPCPADSLWEATRKAIAQIGASVAAEDKTAGLIRAHMSVNVWSWGEVLEVTVRTSPEGGSEVVIESRSRFPLTLIDWGKNKRNVMGMLSQIETSILASSPGGETRTVEEAESALRRLAQMRDDGLITDEEYEEKRRALVEKL